MKNKKRWIAVLFALLAVCVTALLYFQSRPSQRPQVPAAGPALIKFKAVREDLTSVVEVKGKSTYQQETYINAPFGADVKTWSVKEGAQVQQGDILFQLDDTALRNEIADLQAEVKQKEMDIKLGTFQQSIDGAEAAEAGISETEAKRRYADSEKRKLQEEISRMNAEHAKTRIEAQTAKLQGARFAAPVNGIFLFEETKEPQSLKENERVGRIVDLTKLQLIATVGEFDLFRLKEGLPAEITVDALKGVKLKGQIERLSKFAKTSTTAASSAGTAAQFEVIISLEPHERLIAGLSLSARIETDKKSGVLVVPTLAIQREKDEFFVMVETAPGTLERRNLKLGLETPEKTEVLSGLSEGDTIVLQ